MNFNSYLTFPNQIKFSGMSCGQKQIISSLHINPHPIQLTSKIQLGLTNYFAATSFVFSNSCDIVEQISFFAVTTKRDSELYLLWKVSGGGSEHVNMVSAPGLPSEIIIPVTQTLVIRCCQLPCALHFCQGKNTINKSKLGGKWSHYNTS